MTERQFRTVYPHVIGWIRDTLASHAAQAQIVASVGFRRLPLYFSLSLLASAKFVAVERVPMPPLANQIEARCARAKAHANNLTQSILAKAFRGELVPTETELSHSRRE
ncbi:MAG: hypothetical protein HY211_02455 [Candidatus Omnitrophica bacterium]|nr:hypothetical protein [Candidatus Omnitrophota bacterium]